MSNNPTQKPAWKALEQHVASLTNLDLNTLFAQDAKRFEELSVSDHGILFDYSKNHVTFETLDLLIQLARECAVAEKRDAMYAGEPINITEDRAALHTALRDPEDRGITVDSEAVSPFVQSALQRLLAFKKDLQSGAFTGYTGKKITDVVSIGIGGSHLGPQMAVEALRPFHQNHFNIHFVANIDGADLTNTLSVIDPETTLFIVASKSFSTLETMRNAQSARTWMIEKLGNEDCVARHFVAVSTNEQAVTDFGIDPQFMFPIKNWIGGRYSLWSAIGLPILLAIGFDQFKRLLDGAHTVDQHFKNAPLRRNIPVLMALLGIWYRNFIKVESYAILPYAENLSMLPGYLQQLDMESNGKATDLDGNAIQDYDTAPVIFGQAGTNAQHAFFQMLHQGTTLVPCDFIGFKATQDDFEEHHHLLLNNMLAQSQALMRGRSLEESHNDPHRSFSGNKPSSTLLFETLDPYNLGMLLALYEHKVFVQGVIWNINSFDQFGVELGKDMARIIEKGENPDLDGSTRGLLSAIHAKS